MVNVFLATGRRQPHFYRHLEAKLDLSCARQKPRSGSQARPSLHRPSRLLHAAAREVLRRSVRSQGRHQAGKRPDIEHDPDRVEPLSRLPDLWPGALVSLLRQLDCPVVQRHVPNQCNREHRPKRQDMGRLGKAVQSSARRAAVRSLPLSTPRLILAITSHDSPLDRLRYRFHIRGIADSYRTQFWPIHRTVRCSVRHWRVPDA